MFKKISSLALCSAVALSVAVPVQAEVLLSQLRGHDTYANEPQLNMSDFVVGRVRGVVGGIMSVTFYEPVTIGNREITRTTIAGGATAGDDVLFQVIDDQLVYFGPAHPTWISRLKIKPER